MLVSAAGSSNKRRHNPPAFSLLSVAWGSTGSCCLMSYQLCLGIHGICYQDLGLSNKWKNTRIHQNKRTYTHTSVYTAYKYVYIYISYCICTQFHVLHSLFLSLVLYVFFHVRSLNGSSTTWKTRGWSAWRCSRPPHGVSRAWDVLAARCWKTGAWGGLPQIIHLWMDFPWFPIINHPCWGIPL